MSGSLQIDAGIYENDSECDSAPVTVESEGTLVVNGGSFRAAVHAINSSGVLEIHDGNFVNSARGFSVNPGSSAKLTGGTFGSPDPTYGHAIVSGTLDLSEHPNPVGLQFFMSEGAQLLLDEENFFYEKDANIATVYAEAEWRKEGELVGQGSLQSALNAAQNGVADEVKLLQAIEGVEEPYSIQQGSFTVDINGQSLSSYEASFFTVAGPAR
jgi:hypothetical protein